MSGHHDDHWRIVSDLERKRSARLPPDAASSGEKSYRFLALIDVRTRATASSQPPIILRGANTPHVFEQPEPCRKSRPGLLAQP